MNPITLTERLDEFFLESPNNGGPFSRIIKCPSTPCFTHSYVAEEIAGRVDESGRMLGAALCDANAPFGSFRFIIRIKAKEGTVDASGLYWKPAPYVVFVIQMGKNYSTLAVYKRGDQGEWTGQRDMWTRDCKVIPPSEQKEEKCEGHQSYGIRALEVLIEDIMNPSNFCATVTRDPKGRSVEWVKAREHIVIINKRHAANNASVKSGDVVANDEAKNIQRMAHSRRAHYRILRSPRYKNNVGKKIFVRSAWIGPPEWKDTCGNIYKIRLDDKSYKGPNA